MSCSSLVFSHKAWRCSPTRWVSRIRVILPRCSATGSGETPSAYRARFAQTLANDVFRPTVAATRLAGSTAIPVDFMGYSQGIPMSPRRLFLASCIALIATAMSFAIRGDIMGISGPTGLQQDRTRVDQRRRILGVRVLDSVRRCALRPVLGIGRLLKAAAVGHIGGVLLTILRPRNFYGDICRDRHHRYCQWPGGGRHQSARRDAVSSTRRPPN